MSYAFAEVQAAYSTVWTNMMPEFQFVEIQIKVDLMTTLEVQRIFLSMKVGSLKKE